MMRIGEWIRRHGDNPVRMRKNYDLFSRRLRRAGAVLIQRNYHGAGRLSVDGFSTATEQHPHGKLVGEYYL